MAGSRGRSIHYRLIRSRRFVAVRRPYILLFRDERDTVVRGLINLSNSRIEYSEDAQVMMKVRCCAMHARAFLCCLT